MPLSMPRAELIGTFLEALGYGAYFVVFIECLRVLYIKHKTGRDMRYLLATAFVIFSLITVHLIVDIVRAIDAFTDHMDVAHAPEHFYGTINTTLNVAKSATYVTVTLVLDALIVYRTFVVWGRNYHIIAFPFLLFLADIGLSAWSIWSLMEVKFGDDVLAANVTLRVKYFYTVTLALNLFCTLMIAYKIWSVHRCVLGHAAGGVRITGIISVIVESAAIYSVLLVFLIVTSAVGSVAMFLVLTSISPIIGIVFSAVIVRASREYHTDSFMTTNMSFAVPSDFTNRHSDASVQHFSQYYPGSLGTAGSGMHVNLDPTKVMRGSEIELEKMEAVHVREVV